MKKTLLLSLFVLISLINFAYAHEYSVSSLNVTLYDNAIFTASIDGKEIGVSVTDAEVDGLPEGRYFLKVVKETNFLSSKPDVVFADYVFIPAGYSLFAVIDDNGRFVIYKKGNYSFHKEKNEWYYQDICNCNCSACRNCVDKQKDPEIGYKDECKYKAIKDNDFNDLVSTIKKLTFEDSQLSVVKEALDKNIVTTAQVKQLLKLFTFETTKVEVAKYAYKSTCDKNVYFNIYEVFGFESSIIEVKNFIDGK